MGKIRVVGIGPGDFEDMTLRAVNALKACDADIVGVHIAEEGEGRVSCQLLLEKRIVLRALRCVASLAGEAQVFVHLFVGIGAKIAALAGCKNLVGVIVGVKGTAPAN